MVRLYVAWPGMEPQRGAFSQAYLSEIASIGAVVFYFRLCVVAVLAHLCVFLRAVDRLAKMDIYTILDVHQIDKGEQDKKQK